jgi:phosphoglycolate phosphatase-like HAD superfamily hydrolase
VSDPQERLKAFSPKHGYFIGIDSDGCAFDTMEVKWKECFIPQLIRHFGLAAVSRFAREASEYINLYSPTRGINRFPSLVLTLDLLATHPEVIDRGVSLLELRGLRNWVQAESNLSNPVLKAAVAATGDPDLIKTLLWSEAVNQSIRETVHNVPPFPSVRKSLEAISADADIMVVSATPSEALDREWREHDLASFVKVIAGQEMGTKTQVLDLATSGKYEPNCVLMIGDAPGDLAAARNVGALFYPIEPGHEEASWKRFHAEALPRFFNQTYAGDFMNERLAAFHRLLPDKPPWA